MEYPNHNNRRSDGMATAALVLGIIGLATFCCVYTPIILGALAIIFALLSRGGERTMSSRANAGLVLGIIGIALGITMFAVSFVIVIVQYGSFDNYMNHYQDLFKYYQYYQNL